METRRVFLSTFTSFLQDGSYYSDVVFYNFLIIYIVEKANNSLSKDQK